MSHADTIAAIATARGEAAIGIIRTSGPRAIEIAQALNALPIDSVDARGAVVSHHAYVRAIKNNGQLLDEALVLPFLAPRTFTGEDIVEYHCHGGAVTVERVLEALLSRGARVAEPGEFSRRAMLNGKLDLLQVEAIADIIHAESVAAQELAQAHLAGHLSDAINQLKEPLAELITLVEAAIDFSLEEHVYSITAAQITDRAAPVLNGVRELLKTYTSGRLQHEGVRVAIVGKPNAGKSTLLNLMLREERAIVTDIAGTTRDYIEEPCRVSGMLFRLIDTAGIRDTADVVEAAGVQRSQQIARDADAVLLLADATDPEPLDGVDLSDVGAPIALLWTKQDRLEPDAAAPELRAGSLTPAIDARVSLLGDAARSAIEALLLELAARAGYADTGASVLLTRARHFEVLSDAREALERGIAAAQGELPHEFIASDLRGALDALGELTGAITSETILNRIFGDFCIGK